MVCLLKSFKNDFWWCVEFETPFFYKICAILRDGIILNIIIIAFVDKESFFGAAINHNYEML